MNGIFTVKIVHEVKELKIKSYKANFKIRWVKIPTERYGAETYPVVKLDFVLTFRSHMKLFRSLKGPREGTFFLNIVPQV